VSAAALRALADATDELGDGRLELTSRANLQVRGLTPSGAAALVDRVTAAGLLPSPERERIRNVLASPLAGIDNRLDLTPIVRELDRLLQCTPGLEGLSGRFLFGVDDGRGDVAGLRPDLLAVVRADGAWVESHACEPSEAPETLVRHAKAFLDVRAAHGSSAWHVDDVPGGRERTRRSAHGDATGWSHGSAPEPAAVPKRQAEPSAPLGPVVRADGGAALVVAPPLGRLTSAQARWLAGHAGADELRITPWRSVVLAHAPSDDAGAVGLVVDAGSPWRLVSACAGRPRCATALADVQADAAAALGERPGCRVHWAGCDRCCGRTADVEVTMIATSTGYRVEDRVA